MNTTPTFILAPRRVSRKRRQVASTTPVALNLTAAVYDDAALTLTLTFDRAIDISALMANAIVVHDGNILGFVLTGDAAGVLVGPETVRINLLEGEPWASSDTTFTATAGTGIVAVDDGGTWGGVTDVELPFP